jgi:hypothetical protein
MVWKNLDDQQQLVRRLLGSANDKKTKITALVVKQASGVVASIDIRA